MAKGKKKGKSRRSEALDNVEYATLRSAGELADMHHVLSEILEVLRDIRAAVQAGRAV